MHDRKWQCCDFIFVSGDAYIDHPSFAGGVISRVLECAGFKVGIIPQPDWTHSVSYTVLGRPRLGFLVGSGNMDSLVAHYTAAKKRRSEDAYSPGGKPGFRPDRAILKYVEGIRSVYKDVPVIIGGIEASLRRFAHYDYWSDTVRRSILLDSKADLLVYGMGESPILEIADRLEKNQDIRTIRNIRGTCIRSQGFPQELVNEDWVRLPAYESIKGTDPQGLRQYAEHFMLQRLNGDPKSARILAELNDGDRWVIQNPPAFPLSQVKLDEVYELPYTRKAHPMYDADGGVPALKEVSFSLTSSRGCFGGCSFCAIAFHQGRAVTGRTRESLFREARILTDQEDFKGYIHDVGGPTANFYRPGCTRQAEGGFCPDRECLYPQPCPKLRVSHRDYLETLRFLRNQGSMKGIKKIFIRSGIRFDYLEMDKRYGNLFLENLCRYHLSGQLKVAPEHRAPLALNAMGKSRAETYEKFKRDYEEINRKLNLKQYLIPYFMSGHPGTALEDAIELALYLKKSRFIPEQVQDFYPTPGTLSTVMYRTGLDPRTMQPIHVPSAKEKQFQRSLLHFNKPEQHALVIEALTQAGRQDLIGTKPECLIQRKKNRNREEDNRLRQARKSSH
jgi:uncharacterized radical SAM protein YgiQ